MRSLLFMVALATASTAHAGNTLIDANAPVTVARSGLQITPNRDWNKIGARPGRNAETWTIDSDLLNDVSFYGGIIGNATLFREVDRRNRPLPRFNATMLLTDIPDLLEQSYRIARGISIFSIDQQAPAQFLGTNGVRFSYSFVGSDSLRRNGEASAAIVNGKLYMMTFEAPTVHYFEHDVGAYRQLVASAQLVPTR